MPTIVSPVPYVSEVIATAVWGDKRSQTVDFRAVVAVSDGRRLELRVHADRSYHQQGWAEVKHWHQGEWRTVHMLAGPNLAARDSSRNEDPTLGTFEDDVRELLRVAAHVLLPEGAILNTVITTAWLVAS